MTDQALEVVARCNELRTLKLNGCAVNSPVFNAIAKNFSHLLVLDISETFIYDFPCIHAVIIFIIFFVFFFHFFIMLYYFIIYYL